MTWESTSRGFEPAGGFFLIRVKVVFYGTLHAGWLKSQFFTYYNKSSSKFQEPSRLFVAFNLLIFNTLLKQHQIFSI